MNQPQIKFVDWDHLHSQLRSAFEADIEKMSEWLTANQTNLEAATWIGIGYLKDKKAITWPERNDSGEIVGIGCRSMDGPRKWMIPTSKHGLIFAHDPDFGGVPKDVDHPILIVEGATDVLACVAREIYAIGKPSARGTVESNLWLENLVKDRHIALVSENDKGVGAVAFLDAAEPMAKKAKSVRAINPPLHCKDIRDWFKSDDDALLEIEDQLRNRRPWSDDPGCIAIPEDILRDTAPLRVADQLIKEHFSYKNKCTLRYWNGLWYKFCKNRYIDYGFEYIRADLYQWLDTKMTMEKVANGDWLEKKFTPTMHGVTQIIDALKAHPSVLVPPNISMPSWLDTSSDPPAPHEMIVFQNGILILNTFLESETHGLMEPTPDWFSQTCCPHNFAPETIGDAKPFLDFLNTALNGDQQAIDLLQEWLGYCMTSDNRFEKFMMFTGRPASGKGTTMDVMSKVIGENNIYSCRIASLAERFGLFPALGKSNIFMADAHVTNLEKATGSLEKLKTITGRGNIDLEAKGKNAFSQALDVRFTMSVNELPNFGDNASALKRRTLMLSFPNSWQGKEDHNLKSRLTDPKVLQAVAMWALEGLRRLITNGRFTNPQSSQSLMAAFEQINSPVSSFVSERCQLKADAWVSKKELYKAWSQYCDDEGLTVSANNKFASQLYKACINIKPGKQGPAGHQFQVFRGVTLKPEYSLPGS